MTKSNAKFLAWDLQEIVSSIIISASLKNVVHNDNHS